MGERNGDEDQDFEAPGVVSIWAGQAQESIDEDILRERCGVDDYEIDDQEVNAMDDYALASLPDLLAELSYSESYSQAVEEAAARKGITSAAWVIAQYDFEYDPDRISATIAADPAFIGSFPYEDPDAEE